MSSFPETYNERSASSSPCKVVHDSLLDYTLWILDSRYWIPHSLSKEIGLWILTLSGPDSGLLELNSRFHK